MHLYSQVENYLRQSIADETLKSGDMIETEAVLAEKFAVSRPTVRQALNRLVHQGYLRRVKGKGSFVTRPKTVHGSTSFVSGYRKEVEEQNGRLLTEVVELGVVRGGKKICNRLKVRVNSELIRLTRLRRIDGRGDSSPVVLTTVYVAKSVFPELLHVDFSGTSLYDVLDANGLRVCRASRELEVMPAPSDAARLLRISGFEPVIFIASCGYLDDGTPVEYSESYYPAGNSKFLIEVRR